MDTIIEQLRNRWGDEYLNGLAEHFPQTFDYLIKIYKNAS